MRLPLLPAMALLLVAPVAAQTPTMAPAAPAAAAKLTPEQEAKLLALGKTYTRWFLAGKADSLIAAMAPGTLEELGGVAGLEDVMARVTERAGLETKVVEEKMTYRNGQPQFWHAGEFSAFSEDELVIRWVMTPEGKITGAGIGPKGQTPAPDGAP